jgi:hypothetical protein
MIHGVEVSMPHVTAPTLRVQISVYIGQGCKCEYFTKNGQIEMGICGRELVDEVF